MAQQGQAGYGTATLLLAAGSSAIAGLALGYTLAKREFEASASGSGGTGRLSPPKLFYGARLGGGVTSTDSTPAATPRTLSRSDSASGGGLRMVLLVRSDVPLSRAEVAEQAARALLGMFKKQFKRRDPNLRPWEEGGYRMKVLAVDSQNDMLLQQAAARALTIPTHSYVADRDSKQRTVMAVGPAPAETLAQITGHLRELAT